MIQFFNKINTLLSDYEEQLTVKGIKCTVSKRYFETKVSMRLHNHSSLLYEADVYLAEKRENKKYKHQRNRYHCAVLRFSPIEKNTVKEKDCKEYSFIISKIERLQEGDAPKEHVYREEKILYRIEKLIKKILSKAEKKTAVKVCKENWTDVFRYLFTNNRYAYKKSILGKDIFFWELIFSGIVLSAFVIIALCIWIK